jgi:cytokinesis protein
MDRKTLIETLNKHLERTKTISILEGRGKKTKDNKQGDGEDDEDDQSDDGATPRKSDVQRGTNGSRGRSQHSKAARISGVPNGHESQFMDADEADERAQINHQLVANAKFV